MRAFEKLDSYMLERGFKQKAIAEKAGYSAQQMSYILSGKKPLSADDLKRICDAMEITPNDIYYHNRTLH